jgi:hypothetical protein
MTHSKMVQTRRRRGAAKKRRARTDKLAKKLESPNTPSERAGPQQSATAS